LIGWGVKGVRKIIEKCGKQAENYELNLISS